MWNRHRQSVRAWTGDSEPFPNTPKSEEPTLGCEPCGTGTGQAVQTDVTELPTEQRATLNIYMFIIITIYITPKSSPTAIV